MSGCPFEVGDVVECIGNDFEQTKDGGYADLPKPGAIYRVRYVTHAGVDAWAVDVGIDASPFPGHHFAAFRRIDDGVSEEFRHAMRSIKRRTPVSA